MAPGSGIRMMNGSSHDWKFTTISRYTRVTARIRPSARRPNELCIVSTWPRMTIDAPGTSFGRRRSTTARTLSPTVPRSLRSMFA